MAERLIEEAVATLGEQTVAVPGTGAAALIVPTWPDPWPQFLTSANCWLGGSRGFWRLPTLLRRS